MALFRKTGADPNAGQGSAPFPNQSFLSSIPVLRNLAAKVRTLNTLQTGAPNDKPRLDILYLGNESRVQIPRLALSYLEQQELSYLCPAMSAAQIKHRQEVFRHMGSWKPRFQRRCTKCDARYKDDVPHIPGTPAQVDPMTGQTLVPATEAQEHCPKCGSVGTLTAPNPEDHSFAQGKFDKINAAGQSLWKVLYQFHDDLTIADDAYLVAIPRYWWKPDLDPSTNEPWLQGHENFGKGHLLREVKEIIRGNPAVLRIVGDGKGNYGGAFLGCPLHRQLIFNMGMTPQGSPQTGYFNTDAHQANPYATSPRTPACCPKCKEAGRIVQLKDVWFVATEAGGQKPVAYYFEDEVLHTSFFRPSLLYGISPVVTLYREGRALVKMAEYVQEYFERRRIPRGVVLVRRSANSPNTSFSMGQQPTEDLKNKFNRTAADDQQDIPIAAVGGADDIKFVPFADKLSEMEYIPVREEYKRNIGGFYGLSPLFMAQTEGSGGLGSDSQQLAVTNRAIEAAQNVYNHDVFPWLCRLLDVHEWTYELEKPERQDILAEVQLEQANTELALAKTQLGFTVKYYDAAKKRYVFSEKPEQSQQNGPQAPGPQTPGAPDRGPYNTVGHNGSFGDESEGRSTNPSNSKPKPPVMQQHEGGPKAPRSGDAR